MISRANANYQRISVRKARVIINLVRGRDAAEALQLLDFVPKAASPVVKKLLASAIANAKVKRPDVDVDSLYVSHASADKAPDRAHAPLAPARHGSRDAHRKRRQPHPHRARRTLNQALFRSRRQDEDGTKDSSVRLPARRHQDVDEQVVRGQASTRSGCTKTCASSAP